MIVPVIALVALTLFSTPAAATVVTDWNNAALAEVRVGTMGPSVVARALAIAHTCMYDAWAAYDGVAVGTVLGGSLRRPAPERTDANKAEALSFAAYRCLLNLFPGAAPAARLTAVVVGHGYVPPYGSMDITTAAGIGNVAAQAVIDARRHDGSNQYGDLSPGAYSDYTGYVPRNLPLEFCTPVIDCAPHQPPNSNPFHAEAPNHWQPLINDHGITQKFSAPHWERVTPFALSGSDEFDDDVVPPPDFLKNAGHYQRNANEILKYSRTLDTKKKLIVEYWADGPSSEFPAGHWGLLAQYVSQRDHHSIDDDAKMFFAMHNASFDAGIVAWHLKRRYDSVRPITAVRHLTQGRMVRAFGGPGRPTQMILGEKWMPYNPGSNLTPAFPGYISGHATFSSASAEVLRRFTGSDDFGFSTVIPPNFGRVEPGIPSVPTTISFATFREAAEQAGLSRLWGGIHFSDDVEVGHVVGALIGQKAWEKALSYFNGGA